MDNNEFNEVLSGVHENMDMSLASKGQEYSTKEDRLKNFKDIASLCGMEPEQVLFVLVAKHLIATRDAIFELPDKVRERGFWLEKTGDMVNYYGPLLQALLVERGAM
jgi:hypothetical protein